MSFRRHSSFRKPGHPVNAVPRGSLDPLPRLITGQHIVHDAFIGGIVPVGFERPEIDAIDGADQFAATDGAELPAACPEPQDYRHQRQDIRRRQHQPRQLQRNRQRLIGVQEILPEVVSLQLTNVTTWTNNILKWDYPNAVLWQTFQVRLERMPSTLHRTSHALLRYVIVAARRDRGLTQQHVADALGRPQSYIAKIEGGERRLDILEFVDLCRAMEADPATVFADALTAIDNAP